MDRRKATNAKDPPVAENPNGVVVAAEAVSRPSSLPQNSEEEEVCDKSGASPAPQPLLAPLRGLGSGKPPFFVPALREKGFFWS